MAEIFISHSSSDNEEASELTEILRLAGFGSLFLDLDPESRIEAGAEWERTLYAKLASATQ
jgi:hypothetical protein